MKKLWCHIVCSPEQSSVITAYKLQTKESSNSDLLNIDCNLHAQTARDVFTSCKDSPHIQNLGVRDYEDFFRILGEKSVIVSHAITNFKYSDSGLKLDIARCAAEDDKLYGYNVKPCQCLNCEEKCLDSYSTPQITIGKYEWCFITTAYSCLAVFLVCLAYLPRLFKDKQD